MTDTIIDRNPNILGGTPVFAGTRVPIRILFDHLEAGDRLADFLDSYPTVTFLEGSKFARCHGSARPVWTMATCRDKRQPTDSRL